MIRSHVTSAATAAILLASAGYAQAELIYGFDGPTVDGFAAPTPSYDGAGTASVSQSTTTGVTQGTGALHIASGAAGGGYDQIDDYTTVLPADLIAPGTSSLTLDAAANYNPDAVYINIVPEFTIDGTNGAGVAFGTRLQGNAQTIAYDAGVTTDRTYTFSLLYKDPYATARNGLNADGNSTTGTYTAGQIVAAVLAANPNATLAVDGFGIEEQTNTVAGDDLYVDNISIPGVPEPTSIAGLAVGGLMLTRRRRGR